VVEVFAPDAHARGVELLLDIDPQLPEWLQGDPGRLRQVLNNLIGNALKFTEKGEVVVRAELASRVAGRTMVRFAIQDTGIGIPEDKIEGLFEQFTQVDSSTTRHYGGTGLGLAIARQLSLLLGGEIGVESAAGEGSTFWFTVELGEPENAPPAHAAPKGLVGRRVLVVDDNATNRKVLAAQLDAWGARHEEVCSAAEGIQALHEAKADGDSYRLVLVDYQMPEMDGEEFSQFVRNDVDLASTVMIMLTSVSNRGDSSYWKALGFAAALTKPVRPYQLQDAILQALAPRPARAEGKNALAPADDDGSCSKATSAVEGTLRILVADDNQVNQAVASHMLKKLGHDVDIVATGVAAVDALERTNYDLVFMDCQMPDLDGYQATAEIRRREGSMHHIPIVAMTAHAMLGDREKCLAAGMDDYVTKPLLSDSLKNMVATWAEGTPEPPLSGIPD